jgi:hypothetical protein
VTARRRSWTGFGELEDHREGGGHTPASRVTNLSGQHTLDCQGELTSPQAAIVRTPIG